MPTLTANERIGTLVGGGRYTIVRLIGEGGFSAVFEATHTVTGREVALKILHSHLVATEQISERFLDEARAMARIRHEGIVQVFDAGRDPDGTVFIALELLSGETLEGTLNRVGRLTWGETVSIGVDILTALAEAHRNGIIHRDIKPGNIFIVQKPDGSSHARLLDFGIAHVARIREDRLTERGMILGTPEYMSPEQGRSGTVDPASDIWSVGIVMYECIVGDTPFTGGTTTEVLLKVAAEDAPSLRDVDPNVPMPIAAAIDRSLSKDLAVRFATADQMCESLVAARASVDANTASLATRLRPPTLPSRGRVKRAADAGRRASPETVADGPLLLSEPMATATPLPMSAGPQTSLGVTQSTPSARRSNVAVDQAVEVTEATSSTSGVRSLDVEAAPKEEPEAAESLESIPTSGEYKRPTPLPYAPLVASASEWPVARFWSGDRPPIVPLVAAAAAIGLVVVVSMVVHGHDTAPPVGAPPLHATEPQEAPDTHVPRAVSTGGPLVVMTTVAMPPGVTGADNAAEFARHTSVSLTAGRSQRVVATCVPTVDGAATIYLFSLVGGGMLSSSRGDVACAGYDIAVVPDMTGDGTDDVVAVAPDGNSIVLLDARSLRTVRRVPLPNVRGLASGPLIRNERTVVAYTEPGGASAPSEVVAVGLFSQSVLWRMRGSAPLERVGDPVNLGLSVGPDATGDGVPDVVMGAGSLVGQAGDVNRCAILVSGVDGRAAWPTAFCQHANSGAQSVSLGPDVDGDGRGDIAVGTDGPATGEPRVVLISGADAHVLRAVGPPDGEGASGFGWPVALGGDIDGNGSPDLLAGTIGEGTYTTVFDAVSGRRVAQVRLGGVGAGYLRVFALPSWPARGRWSMAVADPAGGIRVYAIPTETAP